MRTKYILIIVLLSLSTINLYTYQFDIEVGGFTKPSVVKADTGRFSDARYVMGQQEISVLLRNKGTLDAFDFKVNVSIYQEDSTGKFSVLSFNNTLKASVLAGDSTELKLSMFGNEPMSFHPNTYMELHYGITNPVMGSQEIPLKKIPVYFKTVLNNVSPRYLVVVKTQADEDTTNNTIADSMRFYIKQSSFMVSAENSYVEINKLAGPDMIAGRLNYDSLCAGLAEIFCVNRWEQIGEYIQYISYYDVFERAGWDPRAVDYTQYSLLFWSDADENRLTQRELEDIVEFIDSGRIEYDGKKNLVICSQELLRLNYFSDSSSIQKISSAMLLPDRPTDPNGGGTYSTNDDPERYLIDNVNSGSGHIRLQRVLPVGKDPGPVPGLITVFTDGPGIIRTCFSYNPSSVICPEPVETTAGVYSTSLENNSIYLAVDWRHIGSLETVMNTFLTILSKNSYCFGDVDFSVGPASASGYPGDSVVFSIYAAYKDWSKQDRPLVLIDDYFKFGKTGITTDSYGKGSYVLHIPENAAPGEHYVFFDCNYSKYPYPNNMLLRKVTVLSDTAHITGINSVCVYDTSEYGVSEPGLKYSWTAGGGDIIGVDTNSTVKIRWTKAGSAEVVLNKTVIATGMNKKYKYDVTVVPLPPKPSIGRRGDSLFSSSETGNTWLLDGKVISGETGNYIVPSKSGTYTLYVTNANDCRSELSEPFDFITGVEDEKEVTGVTVFPNPFTDGTTIQYTLKNPCTVTLTVYDCLGREIALKGFGRQEAGTYSVLLRGLIDAGVYTYRLQCGNSILSGKLIYLK